MHALARIFKTTALTAMVLLLATGSALAVEGQNMDAHSNMSGRDHDGGFFLRLSAGIVWAGSEFDDAAFPATIAATGGDINIAIGGMVTENLALHATMWGWSMINPDIEVAGIGAQLDGNVTMSAFGAGMTYYFMPVNLYMSGSVGVGALSIATTGGSTGSTDYGPALDLTLGKEWWVSPRWALGIAGALGYHSIPEAGIDTNWQGANASVRFTASFN